MRSSHWRQLSSVATAGASLLALMVLVGASAPVLCQSGPLARAGPALTAPTLQLIAGTDDLGRSMVCLTLFGLRTSLLVGTVSGILAMTLGVLVGTVAGVAGGWIDQALMRATEVMQTLPRLFLAILAIALFEPRLTGLVLVLGLTSWAPLARLARAEAQGVCQKQYILAAKALGLPLLGLLRRHVLPNTIRPLLSQSAPLVSGAILTEAALGYIGLGDPNAVSLGRLISAAQPFVGIAWWMSAAPVVTLVVTVFSILMLSEADSSA